MTNIWNKAYAKRPLSESCSREISIDIVGDRCIYINDTRVQGGKPYVSENLPTKSKKTTVREVLDAFSEQDIRDYLEERIAVKAYCHGINNYRDESKEEA